MKKAIKKTLIYGGTTLVLGGAAAGITITVLNAINKVHESSVPTGITKGSKFTERQLVSDFEKTSNEKGKLETTLLKQVKNVLAFKLYQEEQIGSFEFQKADFEYQKYEKTKEAIQAIFDNINLAKSNFNVNGQKTYDQAFLNNPLKIKEEEKDFDNFIKWAKAQADKAIKNPIKEDNKNIAEKLKDNLDDIKAEYAKINEKINNLGTPTKNKIDFTLSSVGADYPNLLLPLKTIRDKQEKILEDNKNAFIKSFETKEKGNAEWPKNLVKKYNGATTKEEAIDFLVSNETERTAFKRFNYKINNDFTVEKIITGIYNKVLGITTNNFKSDSTNKNQLDTASIVDDSNSMIKVSANETSLFANKDFAKSTDLKKSLQEKVFFLGTDSLVTNSNNQNYFAINFNKTNVKDNLNDLIGTKIAKVENAIIGLTPNSDDESAAWQYGSQIKDKRTAIRNALKLFTNKSKTGVDYITGYNDGSKFFGTDNDFSKTLIAQVTATQDSSRYKGGDYGWKSQLDNVRGMTAGFGVGLIAAFRDIDDDNAITTSIEGTSFADKMASVQKLFKGVFDGLNNFIQVKGGAKLNFNATPTLSEIAAYNKSLDHFTSDKVLSDDDILKYIGAEVKKVVDSNSIFIDKNGNSTKKLPPVIDIGEDPNKTGHVYIFTTEEYGMHLVRVIKGTNIFGQIKEDFAKMANKQDVKEANTDYVSLLNNALTTSKQLDNLLQLKIDKQKGTPSLSNNDFTKTIVYNIKKFKDYKDANKLKEEIAWFLKSFKTADIISKVKSSVPPSYKAWLTKLIDNKIMLEPKDSDLAPEDIYNWAIKEEEK